MNVRSTNRKTVLVDIQQAQRYDFKRNLHIYRTIYAHVMRPYLQCNVLCQLGDSLFLSKVAFHMYCYYCSSHRCHASYSYLNDKNRALRRATTV